MSKRVMSKVAINLMVMMFIIMGINCEKNHPPIITELIVEPSQVELGKSSRLTVVAQDEDGDVLEYTWLATGGKLAGTVGRTNVWTAPDSISGFQATFTVSVIAQDPKGAADTASHDFNFSINVPPNIPSTPSGPSSGVPNKYYTFSTSATDPNGDDIAYIFDWEDGDTTYTGFYLSGATVTESHSYREEGTYWIRVKARDPEGAESDWSIPHKIEITSLGKIKWRYRTGDLVWSSPAIGSDGTIYVGSWDWDGYLYAINPDGNLKWRYKTEDRVWSSPAIGSDGTIYVGSWDGYLYAINPDGNLKWKYKTGDYVRSSPAIGSDGTIYVGSNDSYLYAINPDGNLKWRYKTGDGVESSPAIGSDGTIYVGSDDGYLYAINSDGNLKWKYETGSRVNSSPAIGSDGTIYVGSDDFCLHAISPQGNLKWRYKTGSRVNSSPAIGSDGTIYVGSNDFYLYAIQGSGKLASTPWPKFHHDNKNTGRVGRP